MNRSFEDVIDKAFNLEETLPLDNLVEIFKTNEEARALISCVLQVEDDEDDEVGIEVAGESEYAETASNHI